MVTGQQVKEAMIAKGITHVDHHDCGGCGEMVFYSREGEQLYFNPSCGCCCGPQEPCDWQEAADWINMQNEELQAKLMKRFWMTPNAANERRAKEE